MEIQCSTDGLCRVADAQHGLGHWHIRLAHGFAYLVAVMDWYSRRVLSWRLSNTLEAGFCVDCLEDALRAHGKPEIFNTDQGSQFTSEAFTGVLLDAGIAISMDGRGRALDNIFVERLWRSVKYEDIYLKGYASLPELLLGLTEYFAFYNGERPHQGLGNRTPDAVYRSGEGGGARIVDRFGSAAGSSPAPLRSAGDEPAAEPGSAKALQLTQPAQLKLRRKTVLDMGSTLVLSINMKSIASRCASGGRLR